MEGKYEDLNELERSFYTLTLLLAEIETKDFILEELDIYSKRTYHDKYWDKIPVLIYNNQELLWPFDSEKIQEFLDL